MPSVSLPPQSRLVIHTKVHSRHTWACLVHKHAPCLDSRLLAGSKDILHTSEDHAQLECHIPASTEGHMDVDSELIAELDEDGTCT